MKLLLEHEPDDSFVYLVDKDFNEKDYWQDLFALRFDGGRSSDKTNYYLMLMSTPLSYGKLKILGVDLEC